MVATVILILTSLVAVAAEIAHLRRCNRLREFLFHGCRFPWATVSILGGARIGGTALVAAGLIGLWSQSVRPSSLNSAYDDEEMDRLLILLDCSLSMNLRDAGPNRDLFRGERAAQLVEELLLKADRKLPRTTLVVFANRADALVVDTNDWNVVRQALANRNLSAALFDDEPTTVGDVLRQVCEGYGEEWPARSAALLLITDGDSEDSIEKLDLPRSIRRLVVAGVGSSEGRPIGGAVSRQEEASLDALARSAGGRYFNGNESPIPLDALDRPPPPRVDAVAEDEKSGPGTAGAPPLPERSILALALFGAGSLLLVATTVAGTLLNPANATPQRHERPRFLS